MRLGPWRWRHAAAAAIIFLAGATGTLQAATPTPLPATPPTPTVTVKPQTPLQAAPPVAADTGIKPGTDDLNHLLDTLQDDGKRAELVRQIKALLVVSKSAPAPAIALPASGLVSEVTSHFRAMIAELTAAEGVFIDAPVLWTWFRTGMADPDTRQFWMVVTEKLAIIFAAATGADWLMRHGLARLRRASQGLKYRSWFGRAGLLLIQLVMDLMPPLAFASVALLALPFVSARETTTGVTTIAIEAFLTARLLIVAARTVLITPREIAWEFPPISAESASYLFIWTRRFVDLTVYGSSIGIIAPLLEVPEPVVQTINKLVALAIAVMSIMFVVQNRVPVAHWLRPRSHPVPAEIDVSGDIDASGSAPEAEPPLAILTPRHPALDFLRHRIADIWHGLAVVYIVGIFCVYALKIEGGFSFLFRASLLTVAVIIAARLAIQGSRQFARRGFAIPEDMKRVYPTLEARANRYVPILNSLVVMAIRLFVVINLFEIWGIGAYGWFTTTLGEQLTAKLIDIAVVIGVSFLIWETMNASIDRYLETVDEDGVRVARTARMRTLLPLLRNAALVVLVIIGGLLIFSELGINIAPLLAGAGVVGLAVGFGSQALVKDVITGLFMVIENTVAVGDLVDLGGRAGIVEAISIRTIKLRDVEGALHTVPFSDISTVKNRSKEFAHQVINVTVARGTDIERALGIMQAVADAMRDDAVVGPYMLNTIDLSGISLFDGNGIQLTGRIKTLPLKNGTVGAEFYRRLDIAFAEEGIELPSQQRVISFGEDVGPLIDRLRQPQA
jgi:moderate conductance mechanosensitive channel